VTSIIRKTFENNALVIGWTAFIVPTIGGLFLFLLPERELSLNVLSITLAMTVLVLFAMYIQAYILNDIRKESITEMINDHQENLKSLITKYDSKLAQETWFYTHDRLADEEKKHAEENQKASIWVATSDFKYELNSENIQNSIIKNISNGMRYYYLVPHWVKYHSNLHSKFISFLEENKISAEKVVIFTLQEIKHLFVNDEALCIELGIDQNKIIEIYDKSLFYFLTNILFYVSNTDEIKSAEYKIFQEVQHSRGEIHESGWIKSTRGTPEIDSLKKIFKLKIKYETA